MSYLTLALVLIASVVGLLVAERLESQPAIAVSKMTASSTFLVAALVFGAMDSLYGRILLTGLVCSWFGDALLLSSGQSKRFQLGIAAFLFGHLAYAAAFVSIDVAAAGLIGGGLAVGVGGWAVLRWLRPHVPADFQIAIRSYIGVISLMVAFSIGAVAAGGPLLIAIGAIGFALSDVSVARDRFVSPGFTNAAWGLPLYFGSQYLLATSVSLVAPAAS